MRRPSQPAETRSSWKILLHALCAALLLGCASNDPPEHDASPPSAPMGDCHAVTQGFAIDSATHVAECSSLPQASRPPNGGPHYPIWAAFQSYDFPIADGYLIHCMEHGAVVFWYHCPDGCADEVATVQAFIDSQPEDPQCSGTGASRRVVMVPDPSLDVRWAASAWGYTLRADCFDPAAFQAFYDAHYAQGPEDLCNAGTAFTASPCQ